MRDIQTSYWIDWDTPRTKAYSCSASRKTGDGKVTLVAISPFVEVWISSGLTTTRAKSCTNCVVGCPNSTVLISTTKFSFGSFLAKNKSTDVKNAPSWSTVNVCDKGSTPWTFLPARVFKGDFFFFAPLPLLFFCLGPLKFPPPPVLLALFFAPCPFWLVLLPIPPPYPPCCPLGPLGLGLGLFFDCGCLFAFLFCP